MKWWAAIRKNLLICMYPSSPPAMRTLRLLKTLDILCANDSRLLGSNDNITSG
jgi:hypothetical protein